MLPIQIILLFWFGFAIIKVWGRYRTEELSLSGALGWSALWLAAGVVVVLPDTSAELAGFLGVRRGADLVIYCSLAVIFFMLFRLMVRLERLNKTITRLTRALALKDSDSSTPPPVASLLGAEPNEPPAV